MNSSTNTLSRLALSTDSVARDQFTVLVTNGVRARARRSSRSIVRVQSAVYAYIRAVRALGRMQVNTTEVASALSLAVSEVNRAIASLEKKGVKVSNG